VAQDGTAVIDMLLADLTAAEQTELDQKVLLLLSRRRNGCMHQTLTRHTFDLSRLVYLFCGTPVVSGCTARPCERLACANQRRSQRWRRKQCACSLWHELVSFGLQIIIQYCCFSLLLIALVVILKIITKHDAVGVFSDSEFLNATHGNANASKSPARKHGADARCVLRPLWLHAHFARGRRRQGGGGSSASLTHAPFKPNNEFPYFIGNRDLNFKCTLKSEE
jgi:hypothetical protein